VTSNRFLAIVAMFIGGVVVVWGVLRLFPARPPAGSARPDPAAAAVAAVAAPASPAGSAAGAGAAEAEGRKIKVKLFYVGEEGTRLVGVDTEVPFAESREDQARDIVEAEIAPAPDGQVSPIPPGTGVRAVYVTPKGEAYVDFTRPIADAHPGGTTNELLTVYAIVDALTTNLPAIGSVQILVDGHEVDTLAGHVDLRQPLAQNLDWVQ
jgi:Sporulation and spore germination